MADTTLYKQIVLEWGQDTDSLIWGMGYSPDNGEHFYVLNTTYGRKYRAEDGDRIWPFIVDKVKAVLDWSNITNKPDLALKTDLTWSNVTGKPDVALKSDVAAVSAVASNASAKADSNAKLIAGKASQADLNSVSSTASSALDKATSNANALASKVNKSDLVWSNITNRPDFDSIASQASQAVVTASTAESQASAAGQAAANATAQASAAKTTADTATATANAAKASASTASATAASAQQVANSASASASATAVALKSKADTATVNAQFTAVNSNVASAQSTANSAVAGLAGKLDKTALTWGNVSGKPANLATTESVAKAQSTANSAVSVANGAVATANSAKSTATSAVGVANTANATANSALTKANSASTVASQASQSASSAISVANQAKSTADSASATATQAKSTADSANNKINDIQANGGGRNLLQGTGTASGDVANGGVGNHVIKGAFNGYDAIKTNTAFDERYINLYSALGRTNAKAGDWFTISVYVKADKQIDTGALNVYRVLGNGDATTNDGFLAAIWMQNKPITTQWQQYYWSFQINNVSLQRQNTRIEYNSDTGDNWIYWAGWMLEKGTVAHDWSPAPEDIQSEIDANSALIKSNTTAINNAKTAAANAQSSANSAQNTANTAIKVSETLKDLGNYTATASGTTANAPTTGLPRTSGVSMTRAYNNGYPTSYGNVLNVAGNGTGQLLLGWSGNDSTTEHLWYRSHRDTSTGGWGIWQKIAYVSDLTWSNISGKPDVATKSDVSSALTVANTAKSTADSALSKANSNATTLNNKVNKSDLTWANISGKPSIPSTFNGSITDTSTDFNNLVTEGHYDIRFSPSTQGKNGPNQGNWGLLDVKVAGRMLVQTYYSDQSNEVYVRNRHDGTWSGWRWVNFWLG